MAGRTAPNIALWSIICSPNISAGKPPTPDLGGSVAERSRAIIAEDDLRHFAERALRELEALHDRRPEVSGRFRGRLRLLCLGQGGALHYLDRRTGLKDIDILAFFEALPDVRFPARTRLCVDIGPSKFGRHPADAGYVGRRMDILGRSIAISPEEAPLDAVRRYMSRDTGASPSAWRLKAGIAIWPDALRGTKVWLPPTAG